MDLAEQYSSDEDDREEYNANIDADLQEAFERGILKPGLNKPSGAAPKKKFVNNVSRLKRKLEEVQLKGPWIERLDLCNDLAPLAPELEQKMKEQQAGAKMDLANNDFERELRFYRQAQAAVLEAIPRLQSLGIKTRRPDDYMAEMAKTDEHMQKVRANLTTKQAEEDRREKIRQFRQLKKFGKKVEIENKLAKAASKKKMLDEVKKFRKGQRKDLDFLDDDDDGKKKEPPKKKQRLEYNANGPQNKKGKIKRSTMRREFKDKKFGLGGRKRGKKANTRDSASDVFGTGKPGFNKGNKKNAFGKSGIKQKRPGKERRKNSKNRK